MKRLCMEGNRALPRMHSSACCGVQGESSSPDGSRGEALGFAMNLGARQRGAEPGAHRSLHQFGPVSCGVASLGVAGSGNEP